MHVLFGRTDPFLWLRWGEASWPPVSQSLISAELSTFLSLFFYYHPIWSCWLCWEEQIDDGGLTRSQPVPTNSYCDLHKSVPHCISQLREIDGDGFEPCKVRSGERTRLRLTDFSHWTIESTSYTLGMWAKLGGLVGRPLVYLLVI